MSKFPEDYKKYEKLQKTFDYDKEKAEVYAEAATELIEIRKREKYLTELLEKNSDLSPFMWTTLDGETKALHKIDDSHLKNILKHIVNRGGAISPQIKAEALSRGFEVPEDGISARAVAYLSNGRQVDGEIIDDEDWDN